MNLASVKSMVSTHGCFHAQTGADSPPPLERKKGVQEPPWTKSWVRPWHTQIRICILRLCFILKTSLGNPPLPEGFPIKVELLNQAKKHARVFVKRNWVFAKNTNFLISISLPTYGVNLIFIILYNLKLINLENPNLWQTLRVPLRQIKLWSYFQ